MSEKNPMIQQTWILVVLALLIGGVVGYVFSGALVSKETATGEANKLTSTGTTADYLFSSKNRVFSTKYYDVYKNDYGQALVPKNGAVSKPVGTNGIEISYVDPITGDEYGEWFACACSEGGVPTGTPVCSREWYDDIPGWEHYTCTGGCSNDDGCTHCEHTQTFQTPIARAGGGEGYG